MLSVIYQANNKKLTRMGHFAKSRGITPVNLHRLVLSLHFDFYKNPEAQKEIKFLFFTEMNAGNGVYYR
jgi:hypothetical protein